MPDCGEGRSITGCQLDGRGLFPLCWLTFTLIRGAVIAWYPYPFIDVTRLGYGKAILNCAWVALLFLGLAAGATALDQRLRPAVRETVPPVT